MTLCNTIPIMIDEKEKVCSNNSFYQSNDEQGGETKNLTGGKP